MADLASILGEETPALARERKGNTVYDTVKRAVILRAVEPGAALVEQQIASAMGCSQGTVREALLRLEQDGLVTRRGYQGTVVSDTSAEEAAQMARIRIGIECEGIRRATQHITEDDARHLDSIVAQMKTAEAAADGYALSELDRQFHLALFRLADLTALEPVLLRCALHMHRFTFGNGSTPEERAGNAPPALCHRAASADRRRVAVGRPRPGRTDHAHAYRRCHRILVAAVETCDGRIRRNPVNRR